MPDPNGRRRMNRREGSEAHVEKGIGSVCDDGGGLVVSSLPVCLLLLLQVSPRFREAEDAARRMVEAIGLGGRWIDVRYDSMDDESRRLGYKVVGNYFSSTIRIDDRHARSGENVFTLFHEFWHCVQDRATPSDAFLSLYARFGAATLRQHSENPYEREAVHMERKLDSLWYRHRWGEVDWSEFESELRDLIRREMPVLRSFWSGRSVYPAHLDVVAKQLGVSAFAESGVDRSSSPVWHEELCYQRIQLPDGRELFLGIRIGHPASTVPTVLSREAGGFGKFAAAYLLKEGMKAMESGDGATFRHAVGQLGTSGFWASLGLFTIASRWTEIGLNRIPWRGTAQKLVGATLPLAAGMAAVQFLSGHVSLKDVAIGTGAYFGAGVAVQLLADGLLLRLLGSAGPTGWVAAGAYSIGKMAVTLYLGEKIETWWKRGVTPRSSSLGGIAPKVDAIAGLE